MAKYYAYNPHGSDPKYIEITEQEYRQAVRDSQRYFISFGSCVLECSREEYARHWAEINHSRYLQYTNNGELAEVLSLDALDCEHLCFMDSGEQTDCDALANLRRDKLHAAIEHLKPVERDLIEAIFFQSVSYSDYAKAIGISRQAVHKRMRTVLSKLKALLEKM
jgi:RNA polymerase sigma factor (sigma-70 family)